MKQTQQLIQISKKNTLNNLVITFFYDGFNRLVRVNNSDDGSLIAEYAYDHEGNRVKKVEYNINSNGDNRTTYYVDESFIQIRYTNGTVLNETYYYGVGKQLAKIDNDGNKFYYHSDHLGSTTLVTNQSGDVVEEKEMKRK